MTYFLQHKVKNIDLLDPLPYKESEVEQELVEDVVEKGEEVILEIGEIKEVEEEPKEEVVEKKKEKIVSEVIEDEKEVVVQEEKVEEKTAPKKEVKKSRSPIKDIDEGDEQMTLF